MKYVLRTIRSLDLTVSAFLMVLIFLDIMLQVYSRMAPGTAPKWTVEMGSILLCALLWMGLGAGVQANSHIRFDMVVAFCPPRVRKILDLFGNIVFAIFIGMLSYYTWQMLEWYFSVNSTTTILQWNKGWTKMPMLVGLLIALVRLIHVIAFSILHLDDAATEHGAKPTEGAN